jgi:hypothetical protein
VCINEPFATFATFSFVSSSCCSILPQGGALWFTDLAAADPYCIFPIITAGTFLVMIEVGADGMQQQTADQQAMFKNVMRGMAVSALVEEHARAGLVFFGFLLFFVCAFGSAPWWCRASSLFFPRRSESCRIGCSAAANTNARDFIFFRAF